MTELFDLENTWKHSEVARIFIEAAEAQEEALPEAFVATDAEKSANGTVEVELQPNPEPKIELELVKAEFETWQAREALVRLAGEAAKSGNLKAAYMIERALTEIDSEAINKKQD